MSVVQYKALGDHDRHLTGALLQGSAISDANGSAIRTIATPSGWGCWPLSTDLTSHRKATISAKPRATSLTNGRRDFGLTRDAARKTIGFVTFTVPTRIDNLHG